MGASTSIEWAANADGSPGATWNPIRARDTVTGLTGTFCVHASEGCRNCYAETMQGRKLPGNGIGLAYTAPNLKRVEHYLDERMLAAPLKRKKPTTYFLSSMTDVFGEWVPDAMIDKLWAVMGLATQHTFIVVTKRAERMRSYCSTLGGHHERDRVSLEAKKLDSILKLGERGFWYTLKDGGAHLPNVWLVVSVEDQANADERIPHLLATPAAVRGVSCEPLLGPIDFAQAWSGEDALDSECWGDCGWCKNGHPPLHNCQRGRQSEADLYKSRSGLDWVICGGESGANARPMHPDWARSLRDQCAAAGVPFFFKQWGEWAEWREGMLWDTARGCLLTPGGVAMTDARDLDDLPEGAEFAPMQRIGKARTGRLLDGQEHNARPPIGERNG